MTMAVEIDGSPCQASVHVEQDSQNELARIWTWLFNVATFIPFGLVKACESFL
jgi:hypothetical protein